MESARNAGHADSIALIGNTSPAFLRNALITSSPYQHETKTHTALLPERKNQMENKIEVFQNEQFGAVRITLIDGEPWFAASDVCKALEIKNAPQALSRLEEDERFTTIISNDSAASGKSKLSFVNEAGLYSLILSSRKPEAKAFKRWVTHEVIPAIRKTGGYLSEPLSERRRRSLKSRSANVSSFFSTRDSCSDLPPVSFFRTTSTATRAYSSSVIS